MTGHQPDLALWVRTVPSTDGAYRVVVDVDEDTILRLDHAAGIAYATAFYTAAAQADYDAAVLTQMIAHNLGEKQAALLVFDLRRDRPPIDPRPTAPIVLEPSVTQERKPFIVLRSRGQKVGQLSPDAARSHATHVMEAFAAADLDAAYLRCLKGVIGLDDTTARHVVDGLREHRT